MNISTIKDAIDIANRLNPQFRQLAMSVIDTDDVNKFKVDTNSDLCRIELSYLDSKATARLELASSKDVETLVKLADKDLHAVGKIDIDANTIILTKESANLLAAAGWLIGSAVKLRLIVEKLRERLSLLGDNRRKYLIVISPKENEAVELLLAQDKLPSNHSEGQHIIGSHRYSMSGEGFRAECKFLYLLTGKVLVKVYDGADLVFCDNVDFQITDDKELSHEKNMTIHPLPATIVAERQTLCEGEFKYELFIPDGESFDISKIRLFENDETEFDPDCYDGLSLEKIKYGDETLSLINREYYGTCRFRYFFGTLFNNYIEYISV